MRIATTLIPALLLSTAAFAAEGTGPTTDITKAPAGTYTLEKTHASITFKVLHMGFSNYTMRFNDFDSTITLDPANIEKSTVTTTIKPASIDTNNEKFHEHVKGTDFLNVAKYPSIEFKSTKVEKTTPTTGKVFGDLTILGVTKPVVLNAKFIGGGDHPMAKKYDIGFNATTTFKRSDFGINYGQGMIGDDVQVTIDAEYLKQ